MSSNKRIYELTQEDLLENDHSLIIDKSGQPESTKITYLQLKNALDIPTNNNELDNGAGYITEYIETDPVFTASPANNVSNAGSGQIITTSERNKLNNIDENANNYSHPVSHEPSIISQDSDNRFVTDAQISNWNNKSDFSGSYNDLSDKPSIPTNNNELTNGAGYITDYTVINSDLTGLNNSELNNDASFITDYTVTNSDLTGLNNSELTNDSDYIKSDISGATGADKVTNCISLTQSEYDSITPDSSTLYIITE